jgi:5,10-methylenetetrahydromethanopterin reductase
MRDFMQIVKAVVSGKARQSVRYEGKHHKIRWRATWEPTTGDVPVLLSASGPKMVKLAGEVSDGVGIGIMSSVQFVRDIVRPNACEGAKLAGRDPATLQFPVAATVSINADEEAARNASKAAICKLYHPIPHPYYDSQLRQLGYAEFADQATELMPQGRLTEAMALVPDEVVDTMTITGTLDQCLARVDEYEGVADQLILARTAQRGEPTGMAAYDEFFELISRVSG